MSHHCMVINSSILFIIYVIYESTHITCILIYLYITCVCLYVPIRMRYINLNILLYIILFINYNNLTMIFDECRVCVNYVVYYLVKLR